MSFDWKDFFNLADDLFKKATRDKSEAKFRTVISRSYYACFCEARNILLASGEYIPSDSSTHDVVKTHFINHTNTNYNQIGINLDRLRNDRNKADYKNNINKVDMLATKAILSAGNTLELLDKI